jgi:repressor LexA
MALSKTQSRIVSFIRQHVQRLGYPPSIREIQKHCGFKSPRAVSYHLELLERMGMLVRGGKARALRLAGAQTTVAIPVFASVPAGFAQAREAVVKNEIAVNAEAFPDSSLENLYALRVNGDSMTGARIFDGDIVIVEARPAKEGDIVVALVDGENTLKRLIKMNGNFLLKAENPAFPEIQPVTELAIQGVVVGVYRQL